MENHSEISDKEVYQKISKTLLNQLELLLQLGTLTFFKQQIKTNKVAVIMEMLILCLEEPGIKDLPKKKKVPFFNKFENIQSAAVKSNNCVIQKIKEQLPDLASTTHLVECGVFRNKNSAYWARSTDNCPPYIRMSERCIRYPKEGVITWMQKRLEPISH